MKDQVTDQCPRPIFRMMEDPATPVWFKTAEALTPESVHGINAVAFAMPEARLFPIHTKVATFGSAAYFYGSGVEDAAAEKRLERAVEAFGLEKEVEHVRGVFNTKQAAEASTESAYALSIDLGEKGENNFYPVNDRTQVVKSASAISRDYDRGALFLELAREAALVVVKKAEELGVGGEELPPLVINLGVRRVPDFEKAASFFYLRKHRLGLPAEKAELYQDLVKAAQTEFEESTLPYSQRDEQVTKWAELALTLDRGFGLQSYDEATPNPYTAFFSGTPMSAIAKEAEASAVVGGKLIPFAAIQAIPENALRGRLSAKEVGTVLSLREKSAAEFNSGLSGLSEEAEVDLLKLAVHFG